jgi:replicative DNA helicase
MQPQDPYQETSSSLINPPSDRMAENALLGSLLIDPNAILDVTSLVAPADFYNVGNRWIYEAMLKAEESGGIDTLTVIDQLARAGRLNEVGGEAYLIGLTSDVPTSLNVVLYARIVAEFAKRRTIISDAGRIANLAYDTEIDISEVIGKGGQFVNSWFDNGNEVVSVGEAALKVLTLAENAQNGIRPNELIWAWQGMSFHHVPDGSVVTVGARPGMGKTSFLIQIALANAASGIRTVFVSREMSEVQVTQRMVAMLSGLTLDQVIQKRGVSPLTVDEWSRFHYAVNHLSTLPINIHDMRYVSEIESELMRLTMYGDRAVAIVDYLQLMDVVGGGRSRYENKSEVSEAMKQAARRTGAIIVQASQLSRAVESRTDKRPVLSDLRETGSIEQDSDLVAFLYRDEYYNPMTTERPNIAEVIIAKNRHGETGAVDLFWQGDRVMFHDIGKVQL